MAAVLRYDQLADHILYEQPSVEVIATIRYYSFITLEVTFSSERDGG